jgi:hypothetical protein
MLRQAFVTAEIALALTVLCGAGLLGRSVLALQSVRPGFSVDSALSFRVSLPQRSYGDSNAQHAFYTRAIDGLRALPGVTHVGGTSFLPLAGVGPATSFWRADAPNHRRMSGRSSMRGRSRPATSTRCVFRCSRGVTSPNPTRPTRIRLR